LKTTTITPQQTRDTEQTIKLRRSGGRSRFPIDAEFSYGKKLKVYGSRGAGLENIDLDIAEKQGIALLTLQKNRNAVGGTCFRNVTSPFQQIK
jgi:lactate dehydrogenase-like 2-hydroxyacid dehydrogenase